MDDYMRTITEFLDVDNTCTICNAEFLDTEDLNIHVTQIHLNSGSQRRFCKPCHCLFSDMESYAIHLRNQHLETLQWCKYCTRIFFTSTQLKEHENKHGVNKLSCSQCGVSFSNKNDLETHEFELHSESEGIMLQDCFGVFSSVINMNIRAFFAVPYTNTLYSCVNCDTLTSELDVYAQHLKMENFKSFSCNICFKVYNRKASLQKHLRKRLCSVDNFESCNKCKKKINIKLFKKHVINCVGSKNTLKICSDPMSNYLEHIGHAGIIPLVVCKFCQRQFVGKVALDKHIDRTHKHNFHLYKYKCINCDQVFRHPKFLFAHFFTKHKDLEPYTCKICDKKFRVRKSFTLHIKLDHKSVGFVEFDENYHVFFADKKSEKPFQPQCLIETESIEIQDDTEEISQDDQKVTCMEKNKKGLSENLIDLVNVNSDFMNVTETECENEIDRKRRRMKRKRKITAPKTKLSQNVPYHESNHSSSDSDEPLISIRRKRPKGLKYKKNPSKNKFICKKCNKNCYTYQNYHHHLSLHMKDKSKKCIKCDKKFKSKSTLQEHIEKKHSSSKLTDTLKQLLERRKNNVDVPKNHQSLSEALRKTIQKVDTVKTNSTAKITLVEDGLSVRKFIESFTPEDTFKDIKITNNITFKLVEGICNPPMIKMTKFNSQPLILSRKLRMPVKFKCNGNTNVKANIKVVQNPVSKPTWKVTTESKHTDHTYTDIYIDNNEVEINSGIRDEIPDVAEEVMLEEEEEHNNKDVQKTIILPNLPQACGDVRIGHLQSHAPFYKIVKMKDVMKTSEQTKKSVHTPIPPKVSLPDGTKLVTVNPLAHLLGNTSIDNILKTTKKYYEPKQRDIRTAIEKAMMNTTCRQSSSRRIIKRQI